MEMTREEIKRIREEKRIGYTFSFLIVLFGGLFNLYYYFSVLIELGILFLLCLDFCIIGLSLWVSYLFNHLLDKDIKFKKKIVKYCAVNSKKARVDYEAGSGAMFIPILGHLFPKLWGQKMRKVMKYEIEIDGKMYGVDECNFGKINKGDIVNLYFSEYSDLFLGVGNQSD